MFNYAVILIVASVIIAIILLSLTILGWCTFRSFSVIQSLPRSSAHIPFDEKLSSCMSLDSYSMTFQYKAAETEEEGTSQTECIICLGPFEEEESVRKLHSCRHMFHTPCIDMWLGSHSGCPLCRTQIDQGSSSSPNGIVKVPFSNGSVASDHDNGQMILVFVSS